MPETDTLLLEHSDTLPAVGDIPRTLRDIRAAVDEELGVFRRHFRDSVRSEAHLLNRVTQYMLRQKGKEIRPMLVFLSAKMCGGVNETTYRAATLVELLHTATLVHDDVVDTAERRRSAFSVNALWKNKIAVLFGDFLISRGLLLSLRYGDYELLHELSGAIRRMSEGELLQIEKTRRLDIDEKTYFRIISDKTASLIAACMGCGALSASADANVLHAMQEAGEHLGLAFQIRDDLFDYGAKDVGKPIGIDLQEKKMTLPLIHALAKADPKERRDILRIVRKKRKNLRDRQAIYAYAERKGGIAYARRKMYEHADAARKLLRNMPPAGARDAMLGLVDYTVRRDK